MKIHAIIQILLLNVLNLVVNVFHLQLTRISAIVALLKMTFLIYVPLKSIVARIVKHLNAKLKMRNGNLKMVNVLSLMEPVFLIPWVRLKLISSTDHRVFRM